MRVMSQRCCHYWLELFDNNIRLAHNETNVKVDDIKRNTESQHNQRYINKSKVRLSSLPQRYLPANPATAATPTATIYDYLPIFSFLR